MIIGITGGIGSGQSTVAQMFAKLGAEIISADKLAREIMEPGQSGYKAVVKVFGKEYLTTDKHIDRKKLGDLVFGNIRQLRLLNKTVHPILIQRIKQEIKQLEKRYKNRTKKPLFILDAAILFETKMHRLVDCVIVVYASKSTRINRIKKRDKLTLREIELRIAAQMPLKKKAQLADILITNSKSLKETNKQVQHIFKYIYQNTKASNKIS
jgi:dephospho-CoA kinase